MPFHLTTADYGSTVEWNPLSPHDVGPTEVGDVPVDTKFTRLSVLLPDETDPNELTLHFRRKHIDALTTVRAPDSGLLWQADVDITFAKLQSWNVSGDGNVTLFRSKTSSAETLVQECLEYDAVGLSSIYPNAQIFWSGRTDIDTPAMLVGSTRFGQLNQRPLGKHQELPALPVITLAEAEARVQTVMPCAGTFGFFIINSHQAEGRYQVTLRKNGADTDLTLAMEEGGLYTYDSPYIPISVIPGDLVCIKYTVLEPGINDNPNYLSLLGTTYLVFHP